MDIMMPEMDGYETMRKSGNSRHRLADTGLTAKAMKAIARCLKPAHRIILPSL
jgi:CheY-like chemotaxis protein